MVTLLFGNLSVNEDHCRRAMTNELFATEKAYRLVKQGIPFRDAYLTVAKEFFDNHQENGLVLRFANTLTYFEARKRRKSSLSTKS